MNIGRQEQNKLSASLLRTHKPLKRRMRIAKRFGVEVCSLVQLANWLACSCGKQAASRNLSSTTMVVVPPPVSPFRVPLYSVTVHGQGFFGCKLGICRAPNRGLWLFMPPDEPPARTANCRLHSAQGDSWSMLTVSIEQPERPERHSFDDYFPPTDFDSETCFTSDWEGGG